MDSSFELEEEDSVAAFDFNFPEGLKCEDGEFGRGEGHAADVSIIHIHVLAGGQRCKVYERNYCE